MIVRAEFILFQLRSSQPSMAMSVLRLKELFHLVDEEN